VIFSSTFGKIRFLGNPKRKSYLSFYKILGFFPGKIEYYEEALLHKSLSRGGSAGRLSNNERLEFLGDAILDAIVADIVYRRFSNRDEGFLTNTRSKIVQRETLNRISMDLGLDKMIQTAAKTNAHKNHIYGNALEAFIGAIYLDKGFRKTKKFIEKKIINAYMNIEKLAKKEVNFKSKLIEWSQKHRIVLQFELIENFTDSDYNQVFQSRVMLGGMPIGIGIGYSKKESHQNAAKAAIKKLRSERGLMQEIKCLQKKKEEEKRFESYLKIDPESYFLNGLKPEQDRPYKE
jgi:ribonuclease-3